MGSGDLYAWIYGGLGFAAVVGLVWWRRRNSTVGPALGDLSPLELALLAGGSDRALAASLAALRAAGSITVSDSWVPQAVRAAHDGADPLDHAVLAAVD